MCHLMTTPSRLWLFDCVIYFVLQTTVACRIGVQLFMHTPFQRTVFSAALGNESSSGPQADIPKTR
jgi:hypothetical protein